MKRSVFSKIFDAIITVIVVVSLLFALAWFVHSFNIFKLPPFIAYIFEGNTSDISSDMYEKNFIALISDTDFKESEYDFVTLTSESAYDLLSAIEPETNFYWEVETVYSYDYSSRKQIHRIYKKGDKIRIDTSDDEIDTTILLVDGDITTVNNKNGKVDVQSGNTDFEYDSLINIAALKYVLLNNTSSVGNVAVVEMDGEKYLYAEFSKSEMNSIDKFFVSLDHGLVLKATSDFENKEYFNQNTLKFDEVSVISDKAFEITSQGTRESLISQ
ncbi:MAG: hypothetical protein E7582_03785 [Ruminococcaceae bacterium]|nr:hypothetical protein [Oscillospiraceae bacterium]